MEKQPLANKLKKEISKQDEGPKPAIIMQDANSLEYCTEELEKLNNQVGKLQAYRDSLVTNSPDRKKYDELIKQKNEEITNIKSHITFIAEGLDSK